MELIDCPLCANKFPLNEIENHASGCLGPTDEPQNKDSDKVIMELGPDKHPSETYSQYYARKGAEMVLKKVEEITDPKELRMEEIPEYLRGSPFVLYCPYDVSCGWMEACNFPLHAENEHRNQGQRLSCPICEIQGNEYQLENNLLDHLQLVHTDFRPQQTPGVDDYVPIGDVYEINILEKDIEKECTVCFDTFCKGDMVITTDCFCIYHKACSLNWFEKEKKCPLHGCEQLNTKR